MKYCYSTSEEYCEGEFDSPEAAAEEYFGMHAGYTVCYVAERIEVDEEKISNMINTYFIIEQIGESISEEVGEVSNNYLQNVSNDKHKELAALIAKWIYENYKPDFFQAGDMIKKFERSEVQS